MKKLSLILFLFISISIFGEKLVIATESWPPYFGENMKDYGLLGDLTKSVLERAGYEVEFEFVPWKRALELSKSGKYDGLMGAYFTKERSVFFEYPDPLSTTEVVFFKKRGRKLKIGNKYSSFKDLIPYKIGVIRGGSNGEEFDNANYLKKEEISGYENHIKKLMKDRVELIIEGKKAMLYLVDTKLTEYRGMLEVLEPPVAVNNLYTIFPKAKKGASRIKMRFNKALKEMKADGTFDKIVKKHEIK